MHEFQVSSDRFSYFTSLAPSFIEEIIRSNSLWQFDPESLCGPRRRPAGLTHGSQAFFVESQASVTTVKDLSRSYVPGFVF